MSLEYSASYRCHCTLNLRCGVSVTLKSLEQSMTYGGLLEGVPNAEMNDRLLESAIEKAKAGSWVQDFTPYLVPPERRDYLREPGDMASLHRPHWIPEWMPMILCIGRFDCTSPAKDPKMDASSMTVIWLQEDFAMPISMPVLQSMENIDWKLYACDFEY